MFKRIMLTLTFAATLATASLCVTDKADARRWWWGWNRPYASSYYSPRAYYGYGAPYRSYYRGYYYAPRAYTYSYYGDPDYYYYRPGVAVRVGPMWR